MHISNEILFGCINSPKKIKTSVLNVVNKKTCFRHCHHINTYHNIFNLEPLLMKLISQKDKDGSNQEQNVHSSLDDSAEAALQQQLMDQNSLAYMGNRWTWTTSHKGKSSCFQEVPVCANCEKRTCP